MENLIQLVKSLKKSEVSFIQHYYKNDTNKKRLKLFNWILNDKVSTDEEAAKKLYGGKGPAYSQLKGRLLNDLMNLLLFEEGNRQSESERFQNEVEVLRKILIGKILLVRKVQDLGIKELQSALNISENYELNNEKILVKEILSERLGNRYGVEEFNKIVDDIDTDLELSKNLFLAKKFYFGVALPNTFLKNNEKEFIRVSQISSIKLKEIYSNTNSPNIGFYYFLTEINYYSLTKDFENLYISSNELLSLVLNNKSLNSKTRLVNAYMQIYAASISLKKYNEAYKNALSALEYTNKNGPNELTVLEYIVLAIFQLDDKLLMQEFLEKGSKHPRVSYSKFTEGKWVFYKAVYLFKIMQYTSAIRELQKENELLKDKSGWLFGHKLLEIICFIELEEFDMIDFRIESLRKLLQKQKHKNITRIKIVFNVLNTLVKTGYQFKKTYQQESENFVLLKSAKDDYYWDPLGYEIIRFDTWFVSKI